MKTLLAALAAITAATITGSPAHAETTITYTVYADAPYLNSLVYIDGPIRYDTRATLPNHKGSNAFTGIWWKRITTGQQDVPAVSITSYGHWAACTIHINGKLVDKDVTYSYGDDTAQCVA